MIYKLLKDIKRAWSFYKRAKTIYDAQSPFLYDFITNVCDISKEYYAYKDIEGIRSKLLSINKEIKYKDHGAGAKSGRFRKRMVMEIARNSSTKKRDGKWLFNTVIHYDSKLILELGTSLGIGTAYLASASKNARVITVEGDPASAYIAARNFNLLGLKNIELKEGKFDNILPKILNQHLNLDLIYLDGNHTKKATLKYFNMISKSIKGKTIIVMDDIYWSDEMLDTWNIVQQDPSVSLSVDLYSKGFLFLNYDNISQRENIKIIKTFLKPWRIGIFQ